ncbi:thiol-disulfide oxidoreductase DCC family protein [Taibaiella koreensis]|uniref:thiol-disulfide oxidoreductase DCC family protein n=1 Tax=Taibaiella koreensis TaxID=1268548 RepID=UPI000E59D856|nr:DCC1-like thiol-disulfide oxidoreductase family protein [Taibaiella koreensis]
MQEAGKAIVLFDGVCNLCSAAVKLIIRHDPGDYFRFASLQSEQGQALLQQYSLPVLQSPESLVLIEKGKAWQYSAAALRIAGKLNGGYRLFYPLIFLPSWLRDPVYRWIARNRYRWWGRQDECWLPTPELRARFL